MMMRCRPYISGATLMLGLACLAGVAQAGSGYVPAPQAIHGPIASEQGYPSPQWDGGCAPCGPVETVCCAPRRHPLAGLKCKMGNLGCGIKGGLGHMRGKLGGCFHKKRECAPVCEPCAPCGDVWPSGQSYPSHQGGPIAAPQGMAAPQVGAMPQG
jgi:hypothetical protein